MPTNLIPLNTNTYLGGIDVKLVRDGDYNVFLLVSFFTRSRIDDNHGDDATETKVYDGNLRPSSPVILADTSVGDSTGFVVSTRIVSKKPSTGSGSLRYLLEQLDDKDLAKRLISQIKDAEL